MRLKVGIILNFLLLGCMVLFLSFSPLLISWITGYIDSGESVLFPQLLSRIDFLPLTLGQFLDQCIFLVLLWFVLSSIFPLVRKIRERLILFPIQANFSEEKESVIRPCSWILPDISRWDNAKIPSLKLHELILNLKDEWAFNRQSCLRDEKKIPQVKNGRFGGKWGFISQSWNSLLHWREFISILLRIDLSRFRWYLFDHSFKNFSSSHHDWLPKTNFHLIFLHHQFFCQNIEHRYRGCKVQEVGRSRRAKIRRMEFHQMWMTPSMVAISRAGGEGG